MLRSLFTLFVLLAKCIHDSSGMAIWGNSLLAAAYVSRDTSENLEQNDWWSVMMLVFFSLFHLRM